MTWLRRIVKSWKSARKRRADQRGCLPNDWTRSDRSQRFALSVLDDPWEHAANLPCTTKSRGGSRRNRYALFEQLETRAVLDGEFDFAIGFGAGIGSDQGLAVAVDTTGNTYVTGALQGLADFDPGLGESFLSAIGTDIFVAKYLSSGALDWARQFGGTSNEQSLGIAIDGSGNIYTTGVFAGTVDFDPGAGMYNLTGGGAVTVKPLASARGGADTREVGARGVGG